MKVECPECHARFKVNSSLIQPGGSKSRCSKCQAVFTIYPDFAQKNAAEELVGHEQDLPVNLVVEEVNSYGGSIANRGSNRKKEKRVKKNNELLLLPLLLLLLVIGAATFWYAYPLLKNSVSGQEKTVKGQASAPKRIVDKELIEKIALEDVRQYFVENEKIGRLFVVEGKVVNKFDTPKELIQLRATLYKEGGTFFTFKDFYAGNVISLFQLQILSQEEMEAGLNAKVGILTNNINVQPGGKVSFLTAFFNPPDNVTEFGLEVIDAKDLK